MGTLTEIRKCGRTSTSNSVRGIMAQSDMVLRKTVRRRADRKPHAGLRRNEEIAGETVYAIKVSP
jgi:hypothetical protein